MVGLTPNNSAAPPFSVDFPAGFVQRGQDVILLVAAELGFRKNRR